MQNYDMQTQIVQDSFQTINYFLSHLFGDDIDKAFCYLRNILFDRDKKEPVLTLVGKQNTGKSSFATLLKTIDPAYVTEIGQSGIRPTAGFIYVCDQTDLLMNGRLRRLHEFPGVNLILITNDLSCDKEDNKLWIVEVPELKEIIYDFVEKMISERSAFISFLKSYQSN